MKTLKTIFLTFALLGFLLSSALKAQDDFVIEGYVTVDPGNLAKAGHPVTITTDSFNNFAAPYYVNTVFTNANGYYTDTIFGGAMTGPNIKYSINTLDSCQNVYLRDTVQNAQGSINYAQVDFTMDCSSNVNACPVGFQSFITGTFGGLKFMPSPIDSGYYYHWDFGDGNTSSFISPEHFYADTGVYYACLTVETYLGCTTTFCDSVYVTSVVDSGCNIAVADFNYVASLHTVGFSTDTSLPPNDTYFFWDFGDGTSSTAANPVHDYPIPVNTVQIDYKVCLTTLINSNGALCFVRSCETISIPNLPNNNCDAEWTANRNLNGAYEFNAINGSNVSSYLWDFGDGNSSSSANPAHHYSQSGYYNACLTISTQQGCTDTYCDSLLVVVSNSVNCIDSSVIDTTTSCLTVVDPVCGCDGVTYSNSCEAYYYNGVTSWTNGTCGPNSNLSLSGLVTKGLNSVAQNALVYLIEADSTNSGDVVLSLVDSQYTSPNGYYNFSNVPAGTYNLKAALTPNDADFAGYLPTYYDVSLFWAYATAVNVNSSINNLNIALVAGNNTGGPGFVSGLISQGAGKSSDPIPNIPILLLDMNDNPVQYTYSDASGNFELDDIAYGTYKLYAEVLNKETEPAIITIGADQESVEGLQLYVGSEKVVTSIENNVEILSKWKLYPNPVQNQIVVEFSLNSSADIEIGITDLLGRELIRKQLGENIAGAQRITIDVADLHSGVYFLNFYSDQAKVNTSRIFKD